jgi:hypothetical protein
MKEFGQIGSTEDEMLARAKLISLIDLMNDGMQTDFGEHCIVH